MYYFLDVDGVLNKESDWKKPYTVNPSCLENFKKLLSHDKNPIVILSSTWRSNPETITPYISIAGTTPNTSGRKTRQEEIEYYIKRNNVLDYLILDDDSTLFPDIKNLRIYITDYKTGLTDADVKKIVKKNEYSLILF